MDYKKMYRENAVELAKYLVLKIVDNDLKMKTIFLCDEAEGKTDFMKIVMNETIEVFNNALKELNNGEENKKN